MSQHHRFWTERLSDKALLSTFTELASIRPGPVTVEGVGFSFGIQLPADAGGSPHIAHFSAEGSNVIAYMLFGLPGVQVQYHRGGQLAYQNPNQAGAANQFFDEVVLTNTGDAPDEPTRIRSLAAISKVFRQVPFDASQSSPAAQLAALQASRLSDLETLNRELVQTGLTYRKKVDEEIDEKRAKLESEFDAKASVLDAQLQAREAALEERASRLDEERKRIDDSDNTTARRQIRERMLEDVKLRTERFGVSDATVAKRQPVRFAMLLAIATLVTLTVFASTEILQNDAAIASVTAQGAGGPSQAGTHPEPPTSAPSTAASATKPSTTSKAAATSSAADSLINHRWVLWFRLTLVSLGMAGMLLYYIRWENSWAQRHADAEFNLQQFHVDVNRANWIIESCLEWKKSTASDIPPELLASMSRGLFSYQDRDSTQVLHPADELASALFGAASKVRLKSGDSEVELDAKKVPKDVKV